MKHARADRTAPLQRQGRVRSTPMRLLTRPVALVAIVALVGLVSVTSPTASPTALKDDHGKFPVIVSAASAPDVRFLDEMRTLRASRSRLQPAPKVTAPPAAAPKPRTVPRRAVRAAQPRKHTAQRTVRRAYRTVHYEGGGWATSRQGIRVANCESGDRHEPDVSTRYNGDPHMRKSGTYRGKWQFSWATWRSVGGSGDPASASVAEQDMRANMLHARDGAGQWECSGIMG